MLYFLKSQRRNYSENLRISLPIILSFAGQSLVQVADSIMVGQTGTTPLAAASLAGTIVMNILVFGIGLSVGLTPFIGKAWANGEYRVASRYFLNSLALNTISGIILTVALLSLAPFLDSFGQPSEVVAIAGPYYSLISLSVIPFMLFLTFKQFMEGTGNTKVAMYITIISNLINIFLNYILIFGNFGAPRLGITGAGVATLIARIAAPLLFYIWLRKDHSYRRFIKLFSGLKVSLKTQIELLKIGLPISGQMVVEFLSLSIITIMMGWIGTEALAANQIAQTMISLTYMVSNGIAAASTVTVSHSFGLGNIGLARKKGFAGMHLSLLFMSFAALTFLLWGEEIASLFTQSERVIAICRDLFIVVAFFEIFDGLQVSALGALRGIMDVNRAMLYAILSYAFVSLPVAYIMGFLLGFGESGLMLGFAFGLFTASTLFILRFRKKTAQLSSAINKFGE